MPNLLHTIPLLLLLTACSAPPPPTTLLPLDLTTTLYLARLETHTTITPTGLLHSTRTTNKSFGPTDTDPKNEQTEAREGQLTPAQLQQLATALAPLTTSSATTPTVADAPATTLRYGPHTFTGTSPELTTALTLLNKLTAEIPTTP